MKKLDWYIVRKFLGTFFFSIVLVLSIAIVFDLTEKMDDFFENQIPLSEIILDYYLPFIPYYMNMFSSLFIFISVIFFTSKLAGNSEIIAMQAAGMSYHRLMVPYAFSATLLCVLSIVLGGWIIPRSSERMLNFTDKYIDHFTSEHARNMQLEVEPGTILYIESFQRRSNIGYRCSIEHFEGKSLVERITADRIYYDSLVNERITQNSEKYLTFAPNLLTQNIDIRFKIRKKVDVIPIVIDSIYADISGTSARTRQRKRQGFRGRVP